MGWASLAAALLSPELTLPITVLGGLVLAGTLLLLITGRSGKDADRGRLVRLRTGVVLLSSTLVLLGQCSLALQNQQRLLPEFENYQLATLSVEVSGYCRSSEPDGMLRGKFSAQSPTAQRIRCPVRILTTHDDAGDHRVQIPAVLTLNQSTVSRYAVGTVLRVQARVATADYARAEAYRLTAREAEAQGVLDPLQQFMTPLREGLRAAAEALPGSGGDLLPGLAVGDTGLLTEELDEWMKVTSLTHLTAVSGSNCAIIVTGLFWLTARGGAARSVRTVAAASGLLLFMVLVTAEPSVLRAGVMAMIAILAAQLGRQGNGMAALSGSILLLLLIDPRLALSYGFALSVAATVGLLLFSAKLATLLSKIMPKFLAALIAVPLAAQLACQPILFTLTDAFPVYGVLANMLAAPLAPTATVLGMLSSLCLPLSAFLGQALAWAAWIPSALIAGVAEFCAKLPGAGFVIPGILPQTLLSLLWLVVLLLWLAPHARTLLHRVTVLTLVFSLTLGLSVGSVLSYYQLPRDWQIALCDVGQGDALLVRSQGRVMLIDTGPEPALLDRCLARLGITQIDVLVLTHFDADHSGGLAGLSGRKISVVLSSAETQEELRVLDSLRASSGASSVRAKAGVSGVLGTQRWRVLWPQEPLSHASSNSRSVVIEFIGEIRLLALGDTGAAEQAQLLRQGRVHPVEIIKVAHHGSPDQEFRLYQQASAKLALIPVGQNSYGHPHDSILEGLGDAQVLRSDQHGVILLRKTDDGFFSVWTER